MVSCMTGGGTGHVRVISQRANHQWHTICASTHHSPSYAISQLLSRLSLVLLGQGTNIYNLLMHSEYSEESIRGTLLEQWANGIKVLGCRSPQSWCHKCSCSIWCTNICLQRPTSAIRTSTPHFEACNRWCEHSVSTMGITMASSRRFKILLACFMS